MPAIVIHDLAAVSSAAHILSFEHLVRKAGAGAARMEKRADVDGNDDGRDDERKGECCSSGNLNPLPRPGNLPPSVM